MPHENKINFKNSTAFPLGKLAVRLRKFAIKKKSNVEFPTYTEEKEEVEEDRKLFKIN